MNTPSTLVGIPQARSESTWLHKKETSDIDIHAQAQPDWRLAYEQLSGGRFSGDFNHIQLPGVRLVHESINLAVRQRGSLGTGHFGLAVALTQAQGAIFSGQKISNTSMMLGCSENLDLSTPPGFSLMGIVIEGELLNSLWMSMYQKPLSSWLNQQVVVNVEPTKIEALRDSHLGLMAHINAFPDTLNNTSNLLRMRDDILIEWIEAIPEKVDTSMLKTLGSRQSVVERACDAMLQQPENSPTVLQICKTVGTSPRKLEYCFQEVLATSPMKYLRAMRLNGVRRDLKLNRDSKIEIADIASKWGFWHTSQFIALYKKHFSETPSTTQKNSVNT